MNFILCDSSENYYYLLSCLIICKYLTISWNFNSRNMEILDQVGNEMIMRHCPLIKWTVNIEIENHEH